jgi:hypothetical protein
MRDYYEKFAVPVTAGGAANIAGVAFSLGPLYFAYRRQSKNPSSYGDLFKEFKSLEGWARAYKAVVPAVKMAPLQSLGYSSVVIYYTENYKKTVNSENPNAVKIPLTIAAKAGFYSALTETVFSVYYLKKMFDKWNHSHHEHSMNRATVSRIFFMTLFKNGVANPMTVVGVYAAKLQMDRLLGDENSTNSVCERSPQLSAIAGFMGALAANMGFAPLVTLQTRVMEAPQHSIRWHSQKIGKQGPKVLWAGVGARAVAKGIQSAVGFGLVPVLVSALNANRFFVPGEDQRHLEPHLQINSPTTPTKT